jgi:2-amino-4-hydroxy-6-hydroxymethyldihydropteridine diphosphokinase
VNAVAGFSPVAGLTPFGLLERMQALEREFGRRPKQIMNEARPLDLDLIAWGQERIDTPILVLPHPRAHLRRFVLQPMAEICPELVLPGQTLSVSRLLAALPAGVSLQRWREPPDGPASESSARG